MPSDLLFFLSVILHSSLGYILGLMMLLIGFPSLLIFTWLGILSRLEYNVPRLHVIGSLGGGWGGWGGRCYQFPGLGFCFVGWMIFMGFLFGLKAKNVVKICTVSHSSCARIFLVGFLSVIVPHSGFYSVSFKQILKFLSHPIAKLSSGTCRCSIRDTKPAPCDDACLLSTMNGVFETTVFV